MSSGMWVRKCRETAWRWCGMYAQRIPIDVFAGPGIQRVVRRIGVNVLHRYRRSKQVVAAEATDIVRAELPSATSIPLRGRRPLCDRLFGILDTFLEGGHNLCRHALRRKPLTGNHTDTGKTREHRHFIECRQLPGKGHVEIIEKTNTGGLLLVPWKEIDRRSRGRRSYVQETTHRRDLVSILYGRNPGQILLTIDRRSPGDSNKLAVAGNDAAKSFRGKVTRVVGPNDNIVSSICAGSDRTDVWQGFGVHFPHLQHIETVFGYLRNGNNNRFAT